MPADRYLVFSVPPAVATERSDPPWVGMAPAAWAWPATASRATLQSAVPAISTCFSGAALGAFG